MPDARTTNTDRVGSGYRAETFKIDGVDIVYDGTKANGSVAVGLACMLSANGTVRLTADGSRVIGKLISVNDDGIAAVQVEGVTRMPSSGTITAGTEIVGALNAAARGYIRSPVAATLADVAAAGHQVIDVSDAANVEVRLVA